MNYEVLSLSFNNYFSKKNGDLLANCAVMPNLHFIIHCHLRLRQPITGHVSSRHHCYSFLMRMK